MNVGVKLAGHDYICHQVDSKCTGLLQAGVKHTDFRHTSARDTLLLSINESCVAVVQLTRQSCVHRDIVHT